MVVPYKVVQGNTLDLDKAIIINQNNIPEHYEMTFWLMCMNNFPQGFLVAKVEDKVLGYNLSYLEQIPTPSQAVYVGHIVSIAVDKDYRKQGMGTALLLEAIKKMVEKDVAFVQLFVRKSNLAAISVYQTMGFKILGERPKYYTDGEDAYQMAKPLLMKNLIDIVKNMSKGQI